MNRLFLRLVILSALIMSALGSVSAVSAADCVALRVGGICAADIAATSPAPLPPRRPESVVCPPPYDCPVQPPGIPSTGDPNPLPDPRPEPLQCTPPRDCPVQPPGTPIVRGTPDPLPSPRTAEG